MDASGLRVLPKGDPPASRTHANALAALSLKSLAAAFAQPVGHSSGAEPHRGPDSKGRYPARLGPFEDADC